MNKTVLRGKSVDIRAELQKIINIIVNEYQLDRIILFGSRAREDHSLKIDSDSRFGTMFAMQSGESDSWNTMN